MDITTVLGLIIGIVVVTLAILTGSDLWIFLNLPGFLIVIGGTFAATLIKFPLSGMFVAFTVGVKAAFVNEHDVARAHVDIAEALNRPARDLDPVMRHHTVLAVAHIRGVRKDQRHEPKLNGACV